MGGNGFRQQAKPGRKERLRNMDTELQNLQMASRISQMMTQQLMQNLKNMHEDVSRALGLINELQYKILAVQKVSGLDIKQLNEVANEMRLSDFCDASDKEDEKEGFTISTVVDEQSTVILTSTTENDQGIFRSRIKLAECGVPDLIKAFMGREVGAKAIVQLNGVDHEVELLGVRQPPKVADDSKDTQESQASGQEGLDNLPPGGAPTETSSPEVVGNA